MDYTVFKTKILIKSSLEVANASLFEILYSNHGQNSIEAKIRRELAQLDWKI